MSQPAVTCAAAEPLLTRVLRLVGISLLVACSATLSLFTRPVIDMVTLATFLHLGAFVAALGMLLSSVSAFWWRDAALRRVEWAAYLGIALLVAEQFVIRPTGAAVQPTALIFALLVAAIVGARMTRRPGAETAACNCG